MKISDNKIGYARVSTDEQHLDLQLQALAAYGCDATFSDRGISGAKFDRPGLNEALAAAVPGSTLVVWRLDRLGRSMRHLAAIIGDLDMRGVRVVSLTEYIDTRSSSGRFTFHMLAALAEFERGLISERTRAGIAAARARGSNIGRPAALNEAQRQRARELLEEHPAKVVAETLNIDRRTLRRYMNQPKARALTTADME
ncbi:recombinase family protein [Paraburkholderia sp. Cpub6]|uniref:recombinase family protein n=1 Tax=Paraburkholderia sp. Cpub6 TaxID=2723094 RepID=UPI00160E151C|nr:recombinase family protein [Paraburkholderia sp. Cpub6]MBB5459967.1 DNA invertase Pin-like site-specific DNA recombinase [Paraburkholderia sp. Cpub6]